MKSKLLFAVILFLVFCINVYGTGVSIPELSAEPKETQDTLIRHLEAFGEGDIDALMADYAEDAVLFRPDSVLHGRDEIRSLFEVVIADILPPGSTVKMSQMITEGEIAYIVWSAESVTYKMPFGTDTFIIRDGKILTQTFAVRMVSKAEGEVPLKLLELPESKEKDVLMHHLQALGEGDIYAIMADYTEDAILLTPEGVLRGHDEIKPFFEKVIADIFPPGSTVKMLQQIIEGEIAYIIWSGESATYKVPLGNDTFFIRDGKIVIHTLAAEMEAKTRQETKEVNQDE